MKIIKSIDDKRLQSSFYEKLIYILRYVNLFIEKKIVQFLHLYRRYYPFKNFTPALLKKVPGFTRVEGVPLRSIELPTGRRLR